MRRRDPSFQPQPSLPRWLPRLTNRRGGIVVSALAAALALACAGEGDPPAGDGDGDGDGDALNTGGTGSGGDPGVGGSTGGDLTGVGGGVVVPMPPPLLSETGLYQADMVTLASGVRSFAPNYVLWSDDADKERWVYLPPGEQIDTTDMEFWEYPPGTKLWKEFSRDGVRVETRLLEKRPNGIWWMMAYHWREDQMEADAVPDGLADASGTPHDIPSSFDCTTCHAKMKDKVLGFSAMQLDDDGGGGTGSGSDTLLSDLVAENLLTTAPGDLTLPGTADERAVLGYLHANCGTCHNTSSSVQARVDMNLWLSPDPAALASVWDTYTYQTTIGIGTSVPDDAPPGEAGRIVPQSPQTSNVFLRLSSRGETYSMPPVGTEDVDTVARDMIEAWITALPLTPPE